VATKLFDLSEPVTQNNVNGAIFGFNLGSQKLISQIIEWLDASVPTLKSDGPQASKPASN